ncbi:hypothetical protein ABT173_39205 [Streptomyces sp. NPDC001795]|uniref:hypothetical protein n=1 Tax=unclassified Streptomyces TaxID=2593676 RepID=UPI00332DB24D
MPQRDLLDRVTVVQRLTTADPGEAPTAAVRAYARHREGLKGFDGGITLRLLGPDSGFVRLDQWRGMDALLRATHDESFLPHLATVTELTEIEHELCVSVGHMPDAVPLTEAARLVLIRAVVAGEPARFEVDFGALVGQCVTAEGYGGSDLLRSVVDPRAYTGILWWRTPEACARALATSGYLDRRSKLPGAAEVTEVQAGPLEHG